MNKYEVVIIGAGIGGLVCGCYLAKNGVKTLIVEQHNKPGGYCTSFKRKGYNFDVGVHYLGSLKKGILRRIFDELEFDLKLTHVDPPDRIILPDVQVDIRASVDDTINEFIAAFPEDKQDIEAFFKFILNPDFLSVYKKIKKLTFDKVLDEFFTNYRIISIFSLLFGNIGLSAGKIAAVPAVVLLREYILDSGYYPHGGMQSFPDALVKKFKANGGEIRLSTTVESVSSSHAKKKTLLSTGDMVLSDIIVSNIDVTDFFKRILDVESKEAVTVDNIQCSSSMFLVYLGINEDLSKKIDSKANVWYFSDYDIDAIYSRMAGSVDLEKSDCVLCSFPSLHDSVAGSSGKSTAILFVHAPYKTKEFWDSNKEKLADTLIGKAENVIMGLRKNIELKIIGTPHTFERYTANRYGSFVGLLSVPEQMKASIFPQRTSIKGVYLAGHWCTIGYPGHGGIPNVAFSGRRCADIIVSDMGKQSSLRPHKL